MQLVRPQRAHTLATLMMCAALALYGCNTEKSSDPPPADEQQLPDSLRPTIKAAMKAHIRQAQALARAIALGDARQAASAARELRQEPRLAWPIEGQAQATSAAVPEGLLARQGELVGRLEALEKAAGAGDEEKTLTIYTEVLRTCRGCHRQYRDPKPGPHPTMQAAPGSSPAKDPTPPNMTGHYIEATHARDALTSGNLKGFQEKMRGMYNEATEATAAPEYEKGHRAMRAAMQRAMNSNDLGLASTRTAELAGRCGACHARGKGPRFAPVGLEVTENDTEQHMLRHQWALDRLWDGLSGPSDIAWREGGRALQELALPAKHFKGAGAQRADQVKAWSERVHALGDAAAEAATPAGRTRVFGLLLETCARCHALLGGGPIDAAPPKWDMEPHGGEGMPEGAL